MSIFQRNDLCIQLYNQCLKLDSPSRKSILFFDTIQYVDVEVLEDAVRLFLRQTYNQKSCTYQVDIYDVRAEELMTFFHEHLMQKDP